jgi:Ni2+-binding GTPase involved in maturation of urease and hydrogenase
MTLLAIDGPAGAGKTTLAAHLAAEYSVHSTVRTIHMDDLYNGWDDALGQSLTDTLQAITVAYLAGNQFTIRIFNWHLMKFDREEVITPTDYLILEGVGAAQEIVRKAGATTYWLDIDAESGLQRVLARDGAHIEMEMRQWQIQQSIHFAKDQTRENCEFKLTS